MGGYAALYLSSKYVEKKQVEVEGILVDQEDGGITNFA